MPSTTCRPRRTFPVGRPAAPFVRLAAVTLAILVGAPAALRAAAPPGYYNSVIIDTPAQLRSTLHNVINDHTRFPYTSAGTDTWTILEIADQNPANSGQILDLYRNRGMTKTGGGTGPYNREHTWPNSYGFPNDGGTNYPYTDCHHLFLCDVGYNNDRANKPYGAAAVGATERVTDVNDGQGGGSGVFPGNSNWFNATIWQTWNGRKGDVARAMFYMDIRYEGGNHGITGAAEPNLILTDDIGQIATTGTNASTAYMGLTSVLLLWNAQDPPDAREMAHTDGVFSFQGNRNPFVDHPEWANALYVASTGPTIASIQDVAADQGGQLSVSWQRNSLDVAGSTWPIDHYTIQRSVSGTWVNVTTVPATMAASYMTTIATTDIASPGNPTPYSTYRVEAIEPGGTVRLSGTTNAYSVDNLAPPMAVATLDESGSPRVISWSDPGIADFNQACVYRGDTPGFTPGAALACTTGTSYLEYEPSVPHYYRVQFSDTHGNLGPFSEELASGVSGVPDGGGVATAIAHVAPNPFASRTSITFGLAEPGRVRVDVFAANGRLVRSLVNETRDLGSFDVAWDGTNGDGGAVPNGLYFVRLSANNRVDTRKVLLAR